MTSILEHARKLDPFALSSIEIHKLSREVRKAETVRDARVSYAGNIVFEPLPEFVEAHLACHGTLASSHVAPFGQVLQEVLNPASGLRQFDPNFILLHLELDSLLPGLLDRRVDTELGWRSCVDEVLGAVVPLVRAALNSTHAIVLLTNFVGPDCYDLGLADSRSEFGEQEFFSHLNSAIGKAFRAEPRVQIVDLCRLMAFHGRARARDRRLYYVAKIPWHESFLPLLADELVRHINTGLGRIRKCLVLDLDNTLWGGVLGEDGPMGVHVGMDDPVAEAHFDLQRRILAIKRRGVLLAVCSKNNPSDVEEVFRLRPEMPLRRDDFVCMEVGWEMKHEGLQRIAKQLNIGTDSLVFLDDNPAEIELIRQVMPEVECVLVPADPALRPACLNRVHSLDRAVITAEDLQKTRQYRDNSGRESTRQDFADLHDYLHSLQTRIKIVPVTADELPRVHQLFSKTNQFNVTTRRYSLVELQLVAQDDDSLLLVVHAEDRFGDLGWIAAALLRGTSRPVVHIDSFILSCRAMGRAIESAVLNEIKKLCFARTTCLAITAEYIPTAKNMPVRELYEEHGFSVASVDASLHKQYRLDRSSNSLSACEWIAFARE